MANPATIADIEARWRPLTEQETTNATAFLEDAWWLILGRLPLIEDYIDAGTVSEGNVKRVVVAMVRRMLRNPEGNRVVEESIDDYRQRRELLVGNDSLYLTPDELADLTPGRATRRSVRLVAYGDS